MLGYFGIFWLPCLLSLAMGFFNSALYLELSYRLKKAGLIAFFISSIVAIEKRQASKQGSLRGVPGGARERPGGPEEP